MVTLNALVNIILAVVLGSIIMIGVILVTWKESA